MKLNPIKWLLNDEGKKPPVLLAVTPPRTGERTLLGVENMLGSIAVPEPFSLELAGDMDGVTLLARCRDDQVVRGQIAARYPQAQIQEIPTEDDPLRLGEDEAGVEHNAQGRRPRVRAPAHLPGRRPPRPRLRPPHRPHGRAVQPGRGGAHRGAADAALHGTRLVGVPPGEGPQAARGGAARPLLHLSDQAPTDGRRDDGRPGRGGPGRPPRLPVGAGGRDLEGRAHGQSEWPPPSP